MTQLTTPMHIPVPANKVKQALPEFRLPKGMNSSIEYLRKLADKGARQIYGETLTAEVKERLNLELDTIEQKGFADYFLIWKDLIRTAKEKLDIWTSPGRSSAAGSLVCYCLGITKVDPLKHGLLFERFVNPDRSAMPDIDIDFEDGYRDRVIDLLKTKYGDDHVAEIISYTRAKDDRHMAVGYGIHACGVALSKEPMDHYCPLCLVDGRRVTMYDGDSIEDAGAVKIDILDFKAVSLLHHVVNSVFEKTGVQLDIDRTPLDDEETLQVFAKGKADDIFMFSNGMMKEHLRRLPGLTFNDLVALYTMLRPGQMENIPDLINRKKGLAPITYPIPAMEEYLSETYGMIIYQEQLILLSRVIAGFSREESDRYRKAVGKKKDPVLDEMKPRFISGGIKNGYSEEALNGLWEQWYADGRFLFNKSHAVCYTMLAYQMMYLKVRYPQEFQNAVNKSYGTDCNKH